MKAACCEDECIIRLVELMHDVWKMCCVPCNWCDAISLPIPKKGVLSSCDNWRRISPLDEVGKVVVRVLQKRLQRLAEEELPRS